MARGVKAMNLYAQELGALYDRTPKAVFAAVALSYFINSGDTTDAPIAAFLDEWRILHEQGIVPQKPPTLPKTG